MPPGKHVFLIKCLQTVNINLDFCFSSFSSTKMSIWMVIFLRKLPITAFQKRKTFSTQLLLFCIKTNLPNPTVTPKHFFIIFLFCVHLLDVSLWGLIHLFRLLINYTEFCTEIERNGEKWNFEKLYFCGLNAIRN